MSGRLARLLIMTLVVACVVVVRLAPEWEWVLHAQTYDEFTSIAAESLRDAEEERKALGNRLDSWRDTTPARRWGVFAVFDRNKIRRSRSDRENGFDSGAPGFFLGLDRRLTDSLLIGVAGGFKVTNLSFDDVSGPSRFNPQQLGSQRTFTESFGPYLSYSPRPEWYVNASLLVGLLQVHTERDGDGLAGTARGDTDGDRISAALGAGYEWSIRALQFGPRASVSYDRISLDAFDEHGGPQDFRLLLRVHHQVEEVYTFRGGPWASYLLPFSWGVVVPNWRLNFVYRLMDESTESDASFLANPGFVKNFPADRPDPTALEAGLGLQFALADELTIWLDYEETFLESFFGRSRISVGIRKQF